MQQNGNNLGSWQWQLFTKGTQIMRMPTGVCTDNMKCSKPQFQIRRENANERFGT